MDTLESRVHEQTMKAAEVGYAAHHAARQLGTLVPWAKLTDLRQAQLFEAARFCRSAIVLEQVHPEVKAMRACVRKYLNVSHTFIGAAIGYFRDCGVDAFNP